MVDEFLGPIRDLLAQHLAAREAASRAVHALRNHAEYASLYESTSKAHARLVAEHDKLMRLLREAEQVETRAAQAELDGLEALMPGPDSGAPADIGLPQPEDVGFDLDVDFEDTADREATAAPSGDGDFDVDMSFDDETTAPEGVDISAEPTHPGRPAPAAPPGPAAPAGLDDLLKAFVSNEGPPAADKPASPAEGGDKKAWLDAMLSDFVSDDPLKGKRVRSTAKLRAYKCQGLDEVQISGLVTHAPRSLEELVKLSNLDEKRVRVCVESFADRGLVELI